ncbi:MAG: DUF4124 domain-containing protein [Gammaproteobacteria bacterium]|nr:DUF4124 domain-containing protein [Gammaproteobacteria bacterium]
MTRTLAVLLFALPALARAEVYRWVDEYGQMHYSQQPPRQGAYDAVRPAPPAAGTSPNLDALRKSVEASDRARARQAEKTAKDAAVQARRAESCRRARERLAFLESNAPRRFARYDDKGNPVRFTEEEHARQRSATQEIVKENCD